MVGDTLYAKGIVKTLFLKGREKVPTAIIAEMLGHREPSPMLDAEMVKSLA
ncbi:MAG: hypothetical protein U5K75_07905 [Ahrensia sp.]|nr:hypothetical protein [Ahrensia sp.]